MSPETSIAAEPYSESKPTRITRTSATLRLLFGISIFWLALSMLTDGLTTLVLPHQILGLTSEAYKATTLGVVTFVGLVVGMLVQPVAGVYSDRLRPRRGRRSTIALGVLFVLISLSLLGLTRSVFTVLIGYLLVQAAANVAQAAQQGFIPDLVSPQQRGTAAGLKGFMDVGGALLGFIVLGQLLAGGRTGPALAAIAGVIVVTFALSTVLVREPLRPELAAAPRSGLADAFRIDLRQHRAFGWLVASRFLFLLGTYAVGRFFLFFVSDRLGLDPGRAAEQAGTLLAALAFITVIAAPPTGWAADRFGRMRLMLAGAALSATGALLLIVARSGGHILLFGGLMAVGSAAFASANWALTADLAPTAEAARFLGLANIGTAGAAAVAGLFGPIVDWANRLAPGTGYSVLFAMSAVAFVGSTIALRGIRRRVSPGP